MHRHTFGKNVGHIGESIRVARVFRFRLATSDALILVSFQADNFEESGQMVNLLLAVAFLGNRGIASQFFFSRVAKSAGVSPPQVWRDRRPEPGENVDEGSAADVLGSKVLSRERPEPCGSGSDHADGAAQD